MIKSTIKLSERVIQVTVWARSLKQIGERTFRFRNREFWLIRFKWLSDVSRAGYTDRKHLIVIGHTNRHMCYNLLKAFVIPENKITEEVEHDNDYRTLNWDRSEYISVYCGAGYHIEFYQSDSHLLKLGSIRFVKMRLWKYRLQTTKLSSLREVVSGLFEAMSLRRTKLAALLYLYFNPLCTGSI